MERHHETELAILLEKLVDNGFIEVGWDRIYRWYGQERLSKRSYKDFYERIEDAANQKGIAVKCIENACYIVLFIDSRTSNFKAKFV